MTSLFFHNGTCPKCGYRTDADTAICPECGLPTRDRPPRYDGHHDLRRLVRRLWVVTSLSSVPNLAFATALMLHGPGLPSRVSCGSLSLIGVYNLIAFAMIWGLIGRFRLRADDGTERHHGFRRRGVDLTGRLCRAYFIGTVCVWIVFVALRFG